MFYGGLGENMEFAYKLGAIIGGMMLIFLLITRKKIKFPPGSFVYLLFLLLFGLSLNWSIDKQVSLNYLYLFVGSGLFWLVFFNLNNKVKKEFTFLLVALGLSFGGAYIFFKLFGEFRINYLSLYLPSSGHFNHNHIGDLWAAILVVVIYHLIKKKKLNYKILMAIGLYFLVMSFSRSAEIAVAGGLMYLFWKEGWVQKYKKIFWIIASILLILFMIIGTQKTLLFSRPYFLQAIKGFIHYPLGVGVGNFGTISREFVNPSWTTSSYSQMTHNIVLEILIGIGVFSSVFIFWLFKVSKDSLKNKGEAKIVPQLVFITLGVNFLFDYTYIIPTMLWLWFISLGLWQEKKPLT